jgi:hypothetical protein
VYFFKSGDTIKNFPAIVTKEVYHIKVVNPRNKMNVEFDFYDGKIIPDSYREHQVENSKLK